jgi:hypothetical protein
MSVPPMSCDNESSLYTPLFEGLNGIYKWNLDSNISINREASVVTMDEPAADTTDVPIIMVGGSNAGRLGVSLDNIGRPVVDVKSSGWSLTPPTSTSSRGYWRPSASQNRTPLL